MRFVIYKKNYRTLISENIGDYATLKDALAAMPKRPKITLHPDLVWKYSYSIYDQEEDLTHHEID